MRFIFCILIFALSFPAFATSESNDQLHLKITQRPDAIKPKIVLAKKLILSGKSEEAYLLLKQVLGKKPANVEAKLLMQQILLSNTPTLLADEEVVAKTLHFLIPRLTTKQSFISSIHLDAFVDRWSQMVSKPPIQEKITLLLFESKEAYFLASGGKKVYFLTQGSIGIGFDPRLPKKEFTFVLQRALVELFLKNQFPNLKVPSGLHAGLIGTLSPLRPKPKPVSPGKILSLLSRKPRNHQRRESVTAFLFMLHELNPKGLPNWFAKWDSFKNPLDGLLSLYSFKNWKEVENTFNDYLKDFSG